MKSLTNERKTAGEDENSTEKFEWTNCSFRTIEVHISKSTPAQTKHSQTISKPDQKFIVPTRNAPWGTLPYPESVEPVKPKGDQTVLERLAYLHELGMHKHRIKHKEICANRIYKYRDNSPWITFDKTFLRPRQVNIEVQGAPFKAGHFKPTNEVANITMPTQT